MARRKLPSEPFEVEISALAADGTGSTTYRDRPLRVHGALAGESVLARYLFDRESRTFSSGCIRTERPLELAELLLGPQGWDQARIQSVLDSGELTNVVLETPMPVLLTYLTARPDADGAVFFFPDVYNRDQRIAEALDAPFLFEPPEPSFRQNAV